MSDTEDTVTLVLSKSDAATLARLLRKAKKIPQTRPTAARRDGFGTTRTLAARLLVSEGGANGLLTRSGLHAPAGRGRYLLTSLGHTLKLGMQEEGQQVLWHIKNTADYVRKQAYHK